MKMKKFIALAAAVAVVALCMTACAGGVNITQLDMSEITVETGQSTPAVVQFLSDKDVDAEKLAEAAEALGLTYKTADESIATVDEEGNVTGVAAGETELTVQSADGKLTVTAKVIVKSMLEGVEVPESLELTINGEDSKALDVKLVPEDATDAVITFASSDENVATVSADGVVTAVGNGECVITTKARVIETAPETGQATDPAEPESVASVPEESAAQSVAESTHPEESSPPEESAPSESAPESSPSADADEKLNTGIECTGETRVTVSTAATGITLSNEGGKLYVGNSAKVQVYTAPVEAEAAVAADVKYSSSDESVATVTGTTEGEAAFTVKGVGVGSATITVEYNGLTASYTVSVTKYVAPQNTTTTAGSSTGGSSGGTTGSTGGTSGGGQVTTPAPAPQPSTPAPAPDSGGNTGGTTTTPPVNQSPYPDGGEIILGGGYFPPEVGDTLG